MPRIFDSTTVSMTGSAVQIMTTEMLIRAVAFTARESNSNPIYISQSNAVSSANCAFYVPAPTAGVPDGPLVFGDGSNADIAPDGAVSLDEFWAKGTSGEKLQVAWLRYR